jgi:hypothetical protein
VVIAIAVKILVHFLEQGTILTSFQGNCICHQRSGKL